MFEAPFSIKALIKLLQAGMAAWDAWTSAGIGGKEVTAVRLATDALEELRGKGSGQVADMAALHLGVITQCFGHALGKHWALDQALPTRRPRLFMTREQQAQEDEIERRMQDAVRSLPKFGASLAQPGDLPAGVQEVKRAERLTEPLATPYYEALWAAFANRDEGDEGRVEVLDLDRGRLEFERDFLLAYHQALASPGGEQLRGYLSKLAGDYRARTLRELLLRDMAGWDERHIFGNLERKDRADDDPVPFMPLGKMYVEPDARLVRQGQHGEPAQRTPVRTLINQWLRESRTGAAVVKADFGMGKSLTARSLVRQLARQFLDERTPSSSLEMPVYIQCAKDLTEESFNLDAFARRAWMRATSELGLKLNLSDPALAPPDRTQPALFLFDGLDEVILGERRLESFFRSIQDAASEHHRFIIFSRPGALPSQQELEGIPVIELQPWSESQISTWLGAWSELNGGTGPKPEELKARELGELASTPILLFMVAQTWKGQSREVGASRAALYEEFFWRIARGKHEADRARHENVFKASTALHAQLISNKLLAPESEPPDAMLWLMGRVAWEATKLEQRQMIEPLRKAEALTKNGITNLLVHELGLEDGASDTIDVIQVGLLLSLQAHLRAGAASQLLFGHKSFREFLVARYWADRLKAIARAPSREWEDCEADLLGGRLLSREDRTFEFLLEMLDGEPLPKREAAPFGLTMTERQALLSWAQVCFESEEPAAPVESSRGARVRQPSLREDRKPWLREAALAIGSNLRGSAGMKQRDTLTMRSMLAWFWMMRVGPIIKARKVYLPGASMPGNTLRGVDFSEAYLEGADFSRADLSPRGLGLGLDLSMVVLSSFFCAVLDRALLMHANLTLTNLVKASLREVDLTGAVMKGAYLDEAKLKSAVLDKVQAEKAIFNKADLSGARLNQAMLPRASFVEADLTGAFLRQAQLQGADFTGAVLKDVSLAQALYDDKTRWPEGFDPVAAGAVLDKP